MVVHDYNVNVIFI